MIIKIAVSLIPVFLLLILLIWLDSLKLVNKNLLLLSLAWGVVSAGLGFLINTYLLRVTGLGFETYSGVVAPVAEELLKLSFLLIMIRKNKIGFMIDGAIYGFSIGAGFAFCENLFYLFHFAGQESNLMVWITRGFGTAVMHCGTTALFAIISMSALNRQRNLWISSLFGILSAILIHAVFNLFLVSPMVSTLIMILVIPITISLVFQSNERSIRNWFELEFDSEVNMLRMIRKGRFSETKTGSFLLSVRHHFPPEVVVDIYCFISLYLELSMKAKSYMMLRENDLAIDPDPGIPAKLRELRSLEKNIGRAGYLAIAPVFRMDRKDLWKLSILR